MKIISWNIDCGPLTSHYYVASKYRFVNRLPEILKSILEEDPDIICLQENPSHDPVTISDYFSTIETTDDIFSVSIHTKIKPDECFQVHDILAARVAGTWIVNKHNRSRGNTNYLESQKLVKCIKKLSPLMIICGDFNFYGESDHRSLFSGFIDCGKGTGTTWEGYSFQNVTQHIGRSDNFFVTKEFSNFKYEVKKIGNCLIIQ